MRRTGALLLLVALAGADGVPEAHAAARRALVDDLEKLATWCVNNEIYLDRDLTCELILRFDPDHEQARRWLKWARRQGMWVRTALYTRPKNMNAKAHATYTERRAEVVRRFADAVLDALEAEGDRWPRSARRQALDDALAADPDHERARARNGQVRLDGRWVLEEAVVAAKRRRQLVFAARNALYEAPEPRSVGIDPLEAKLGVTWTGALDVGSWRVVASTSFAEMRDAARIAAATVPLFEACFGVTVEPRPGQAIYLMTDEAEYRAVLTRHPSSTPDSRAFALKLSSSWLPETHHVAIHSSDVQGRLDRCARQPLGALLDREFGVTGAHGWAWEGIGLYLGELLTGSRRTFFVRRTEYALDEGRRKAALWDKIRQPDADWYEIARELLRDGRNPELPYLMSKDVNTMDAEDLVFAYVLGAYLLEAHAARAPDLLRAVGKEKVPFHDAIPKVLGLDLPALEERVTAWLWERR